MSAPLPTFQSAQPLADILAALVEQVAQTDAAFQVGQRLGWNRLGADHPLLEGYDRLANLALTELQITIGLVQEGRCWLRRLWHWLCRRAPEPRYRLQTEHDACASFRISVRIARNTSGRWQLSQEPPQAPARPSV